MQMIKHDIEEVADSIGRECAEDYVGLWTIPWRFRELLKVGNEAERREMSLQVVRLLLANRAIGVGQFHNEVFHFWNDTTDHSFQRIAREWQQLGHEPDIGEICWFTEGANDNGALSPRHHGERYSRAAYT